MAEDKISLLRFAGYGALISLAAGPAVGIVMSIYHWTTTGEVAYGIEAITLFVVASSMGAVGGVVYTLIIFSHPKIDRWYYISFVAAMAAYLATCSFLILGMSVFLPQLVVDIPATNLMFHLGLQVYGFCLVTISWVVVYLLKQFSK